MLIMLTFITSLDKIRFEKNIYIKSIKRTFFNTTHFFKYQNYVLQTNFSFNNLGLKLTPVFCVVSIYYKYNIILILLLVLRMM